MDTEKGIIDLYAAKLLGFEVGFELSLNSKSKTPNVLPKNKRSDKIPNILTKIAKIISLKV